MDGFGIHPDPFGNAVVMAKTPFLDRVWTLGRSTLLHAAGTHVGLPENESGNSEVGHLSIGTGQVIYQSLSRINDAIATGSFGDIEEIKATMEEVKKRGTDLHLVGILSAAGVHGHIDHLFALMDIAKSYKINPFIHVITDGRDTPQTDGYYYISSLVKKIKELGIGRIASISGRLYSMDRDKKWERTLKAYNAMVGFGERRYADPFALIQDTYKDNGNDETLLPTTMVDANNQAIGPVKDNDVVIFFNFREDRARQLTQVFVDGMFDPSQRPNLPKNLYFVTMTGYAEDLNTKVIFPPKKVEETLSWILSNAGLKQLHVSETEKFMHITYFFNGGIEEPHPGEDFFNIPSPKVFDYSIVPQMSAYIIRDEVLYRLERIDQTQYSFVLINFANPDMVGHTGSLEATIQACEITDECVKAITQKTVEKGGVCVIIADHGNCETMIDRVTKKIDNAHTNNPVPMIIVDKKEQVDDTVAYKVKKIGTGSKANPTGILSDVAPTVLSILGLPSGKDMTGVNLLDVV